MTEARAQRHQIRPGRYLRNERPSAPSSRGDLPGTSSRTLLARPTAKTEQRAWTVFSKAGQGPISLWNHDGSIVRLEAVGRARRFYYVEPRAGLSARSGDIAF